MDYDATDRHMSSWVVAADKGGIRLYVTPGYVATERLAQASIYRWLDAAETVAENARKEWAGFDWQAAPVAGEMAR